MMPMAITVAVAVLAGAATADVMMTMASKKRGKVMVRRWRGNGEAATRQLRGNKDAS